jgi:hypothetical protein
MSAPDYTQRLTDRIFLLSRGCPQMCQASKCGLLHAAGRYGDTPTRCNSDLRARSSLTHTAFPGLDQSDQFALTVFTTSLTADASTQTPSGGRQR